MFRNLFHNTLMQHKSTHERDFLCLSAIYGLIIICIDGFGFRQDKFYNSQFITLLLFFIIESFWEHYFGEYL